MVRPRKLRRVHFNPNITYFKPQGVPLRMLEHVELGVDELESLRLSNIEKLSQEGAADKMHVHQSTFQRTLARAREKVTDALVNGKAIRIEGGDFVMPEQIQRAGRGFGAGHGWGRMRGSLSGGNCKCTKCAHELPHVRGRPCSEIKCPKCGSMMVRK